jgi:molybdate transport system substrate-binding protein
MFSLPVLASVPARAHSETMIVSAAASLTDVLGEIGKMYERRSPDLVTFNFGASSMLARQVEASAPVDVFVSADEEIVDRLDKKNLLLPGTRVSLLSNALVIVVAKDSAIAVASPGGLASERIRSVALAEPGSVPAGIYARDYLRKLGIWEAIEPKVVPTENVRAALAAVEAGNADAAIVYRTDAGISKKVRIALEVPGEGGPKISYAAAVIRDSRHGENARAFLSFLASPEAAAVFRRYGFLVPEKKR